MTGRRLNFTLRELREIRQHPWAGVQNEHDRPHPDFCYWLWERFKVILRPDDVICRREDASRPRIEVL